MPSLPESAARCLIALMLAGAPPAWSQQCPPNSHASAVAFAGSLRSAQCFCDDGYKRVGGVCVRIAANPADRPPPGDPNKTWVAPQPFR